MLRSWFIDEGIVARFKRKDAATFHMPSNGLHISSRRGAQHKMTQATILHAERWSLHARVRAERRPPCYLPAKNIGLCDLNSALVADATPEPCPRYLASQPMKRADPRRAAESDYCVIGSKTTLDPWLNDPLPDYDTERAVAFSAT
jgi:hypothetical protein